MSNYFETRRKKTFEIETFLKTTAFTQIKEGESCISLPIEYQNTVKYIFDSIEKIGEGGFGQVHVAKKGPFEMVIKEVEKKPEEKDNSEYQICSIIKQSLRDDKCPNFVNIFGLAVCNSCVLKWEYTTPKNVPCFMMFFELGEMNLQDFLNYNDDEPLRNFSFLLQLIMAVVTIQENYEVVHFDIKENNLILVPIPTTIKSISYIIDNKRFNVPCFGWLLLLADFGLAEIFSPKYTKKTGNRNIVSIDNPPILNNCVFWEDLNFYSYRRYEYKKDVYPTEFAIDTTDIIGLFNGNKKNYNSFFHENLKLPVDTKQKMDAYYKSIQGFLVERNDKNISINSKSLPLVAAKNLLKHIYLPNQFPSEKTFTVC